MLSIVELQNRIVSLEGELSAITSSGEVSPDDALRAASIEGRLSEARDQLVAEAARVQAENERLAAEAAANSAEIAHDLAHAVLGAADSFGGIEPGWRAAVPYDLLRLANMAARNSVSGLTTPQIYSTDLPAPPAPPMGFLDVIPHGRVDGDEHYFQAPALTNNAAAWASGSKAETNIEWTAATALLEVIAHHMPIAKQTARRYRTLESTIANALMLGLEIAKNGHAVAGTNSSGIKGIINQTGVLTYTQQTSGTMADTNAYDVAVEMAQRVRDSSGFAADFVMMPPAVVTALKKAKGTDGHYQYPEIVHDNKLDGMQIVVDHNLTSTSGSPAVTTLRMVVGFSGGCSFNTADEDEVTIGLVSNQFIQNAYTLLAEGTHAFKVPFPKAFCTGTVSF